MPAAHARPEERPWRATKRALKREAGARGAHDDSGQTPSPAGAPADAPPQSPLDFAESVAIRRNRWRCARRWRKWRCLMCMDGGVRSAPIRAMRSRSCRRRSICPIRMVRSASNGAMRSSGRGLRRRGLRTSLRARSRRHRRAYRSRVSLSPLAGREKKDRRTIRLRLNRSQCRSRMIRSTRIPGIGGFDERDALFIFVMAGRARLRATIRPSILPKKMDGRVKPGHDEYETQKDVERKPVTAVPQGTRRHTAAKTTVPQNSTP